MSASARSCDRGALNLSLACASARNSSRSALPCVARTAHVYTTGLTCHPTAISL